MGGTHHGADFANNSGSVAIGRYTQLATQQKLGLCDKWRHWPDPGHSFDTGVDESVLD